MIPIVEMANTKWKDEDPPNKSYTGWHRQMDILLCPKCHSSGQFSHSNKLGGLRIMMCDACEFVTIVDTRKKGLLTWIKGPPISDNA